MNLLGKNKLCILIKNILHNSFFNEYFVLSGCLRAILMLLELLEIFLNITQFLSRT